ncbi:AAA family ATPase [Dyella sp. ASV21]|uniref:AAA family ATPase n=1 Tax=Dyella sp. ASV21 TaxID=2795114 RepID=UPI0018EBEC7C|nr:AAA family ATPase [Dyella sp. ASV21]
MQQITNDNLVLIAGASAAGKSAALRNLVDQPGVVYLNCEAGKKLPFPNKFQKFTITDPYQVLEAFDAIAEGKLGNVHTVIIDSLTFLLDMFESVHVITSPNTMQAWGAFSQFFKALMQDKVAKSTCNVIFTAHTLTQLNENDMILETKVPVKGSLKNNGIEAYFSCVVAAKKMPVKKLEGYASDLLEISEEEQALGFKYVFQTKLTKDTVHERIRSPMGLFKTSETFMDNDVQKLLNHLHQYYA